MSTFYFYEKNLPSGTGGFLSAVFFVIICRRDFNVSIKKTSVTEIVFISYQYFMVHE